MSVGAAGRRGFGGFGLIGADDVDDGETGFGETGFGDGGRTPGAFGREDGVDAPSAPALEGMVAPDFAALIGAAERFGLGGSRDGGNCSEGTPSGAEGASPDANFASASARSSLSLSDSI